MEDVPLFPDPPAITVERTLALVKPDVIEHADKIVEEIKRKGFTVLQVRRSLSVQAAGVCTARKYTCTPAILLTTHFCPEINFQSCILRIASSLIPHNYVHAPTMQKRRLRLTPEQASDFYAEHYGKMFFPSLIAYMHRYV